MFMGSPTWQDEPTLEHLLYFVNGILFCFESWQLVMTFRKKWRRHGCLTDTLPKEKKPPDPAIRMALGRCRRSHGNFRRSISSGHQWLL